MCHKHVYHCILILKLVLFCNHVFENIAKNILVRAVRRKQESTVTSKCCSNILKAHTESVSTLLRFTTDARLLFLNQSSRQLAFTCAAYPWCFMLPQHISAACHIWPHILASLPRAAHLLKEAMCSRLPQQKHIDLHPLTPEMFRGVCLSTSVHTWTCSLWASLTACSNLLAVGKAPPNTRALRPQNFSWTVGMHCKVVLWQFIHSYKHALNVSDFACALVKILHLSYNTPMWGLKSFYKLTVTSSNSLQSTLPSVEQFKANFLVQTIQPDPLPVFHHHCVSIYGHQTC